MHARVIGGAVAIGRPIGRTPGVHLHAPTGCRSFEAFGGYRMDPLDRLLEHDQWATKTLLDVSRGLTDEQLDQPFDIGHRTLRATFAHMIFDSVEVWTAEMAGRPPEEQPDDRSMSTLIDRYERAYAAFAAVARRARDEQRLEDTFI